MELITASDLPLLAVLWVYVCWSALNGAAAYLRNWGARDAWGVALLSLLFSPVAVWAFLVAARRD